MLATFVILGVTILLFVWNRLRADVVAVISLLALFLTGVLTAPQALAGFSDSTVVMVAALFVVGEGLARTGITAWMGERLTAWAGTSQTRLLIALMVGTAALSAFLSNTGTIAVLLPAALAAVQALKSLPSRFLIPMAFAASLGGLMTLIGTPSNIVIADTLTAAGLPSFHFFEYAWIGLPLFACALVYMLFLGRRLLPAREATRPSVDPSAWVDTIVDTYGLATSLFALRVRQFSPLGGKTLAESRLGADFGLTVLAVHHGAGTKEEILVHQERKRLLDLLRPTHDDDKGVPGPNAVVQVNDVIIVKGARERVERAIVHFDLGMREITSGEQVADVLLSPEVGVAEVTLAPRSSVVGETVAASHIGEQFGVQVLSIVRGSRTVSRQSTELQLGDTLFVRGTWANIARLRESSKDFVVANMPESMTGQLASFGPRTLYAAGILLLMILLMIGGVIPTEMAVLLAAALMVLARCVPVEEIYRVINWPTVVLIAATLPLSTALQVTGGAQLVVDVLVSTVGTWGPLALMATVFLLTAGFSQVISNTATTVLVAPIVLQMAAEIGVSPYPLLMMVAVGASAAFLTPIASPVNTLVMTPGGYYFNDYVKVGLPLLILTLLISLMLVPVIWPL
jgi:di/tricarboxylate transporter